MSNVSTHTLGRQTRSFYINKILPILFQYFLRNQGFLLLSLKNPIIVLQLLEQITILKKRTNNYNKYRSNI